MNGINLKAVRPLGTERRDGERSGGGGRGRGAGDGWPGCPSTGKKENRNALERKQYPLQ